LHADATESLQGAPRISKRLIVHLATGANSHPCSDCTLLARPVPALPVAR